MPRDARLLSGFASRTRASVGYAWLVSPFIKLAMDGHGGTPCQVCNMMVVIFLRLYLNIFI
jgi:hypothetical protein